MYGSAVAPNARVARAYRGGAAPPPARNGRTSVLFGCRRSIERLCEKSVFMIRYTSIVKWFILTACCPSCSDSRQLLLPLSRTENVGGLPSTILGQVQFLGLVQECKGISHLLVRQARPDVCMGRGHGGLCGLADAAARLSWQKSWHHILPQDCGGRDQRPEDRQQKRGILSHLQQRSGSR